MKTAGETAGQQSDVYIAPSKFTPINRRAEQLLTPQPSVSSLFTEQTPTNRQRNPIIAKYLGLGVETEPSHLEKYAPVLPPTPPTPPKGRKRNRKVRDGSSPSKENGPNVKKQRRVSDGFCITKPASELVAHKKDEVVPSDFWTSSPKGSTHGSDPPRVAQQRDVARGSYAKGKGPVQPSDSTIFATQSPGFVDRILSPHNAAPPSHISPTADSVQQSAGHQSLGTIVDEYYDDVFDSVGFGSTIDQIVTGAQPHGSQDASNNYDCADNTNAFSDLCVDEDMFLSTPDLTDDFSSPFRPNGANNETNLVSSHKQPLGTAPGVPRSSDIPSPSSKFVSPVTQKTKTLIRDKATSSQADRKPIVRPAFPAPVRDRSPLIGLSSNLLLRTCFRIGEAIHHACHATKHGQNIVFELYAKVLSSERDESKQHFVFSDLFHDRRPHLKGEYDAAIWKHVELFNYDSGRLLSKERMCRCIGRIKRDANKEWVMVVLNIWEATWEDIEWAEGIVSS